MTPAEREALANVEKAAREVDALLGGNYPRWTLDGRALTADAGSALLSLHDFLNDVTNARA